MPDRDDRLLAAAYRVYGKSALYVAPDGTETACRVLFIQPGRPTARQPLAGVSFGGLHMGLAEGRQDVLVRVGEVAAPVQGGAFQLLDDAGAPLPGERYEIGEAPMPNDVTRKEWRCPAPIGEVS